MPGVPVHLGEHVHEDVVKRHRRVLPPPHRAGRVDRERLDRDVGVCPGSVPQADDVVAGQLSKRVRRLPDETVLSWFQRGWDCDDPESWVENELGGDVYGFDSIFEAARKHVLSWAATTSELRELLREHLYVEGDEDFIRLDDHSLRVRTDDDEVELAYFFLDDEVVATALDRLAYLLQSWPLPGAGGESTSFVADVPVTVVTSAGTGGASTYAVFLTFYDGASLACSQPLVFPGVGLWELPGHLRTADPGSGAAWPPELLVLRALVAPEDDAIRPALERCNRWPGFNLNADPWPNLSNEHTLAHHEAMAILTTGRYVDGRRPGESRIEVDDHLAQVAMHCGGSFGYQQWFLFDSVWATAHSDLAQSLLRYSNHWDPLED
ncbi:hypothetical protein [Micromonospora sp. NPDC000442]|uniref:hypothetical protein n=1 Tax=Micromonospora sp. NPDC000442 TaxID=3364217 RepID=UPI0036C1AAD7